MSRNFELSNCNKSETQQQSVSLSTHVGRWVRTIGDRVLNWALASLVLLVLARVWGLLPDIWYWTVGAGVLALLMTIPFAAIFAVLPGETFVEQRTRLKLQARARAELAVAGLTPQEYIDTKTDWLEREIAAYRFGVEFPG